MSEILGSFAKSLGFRRQKGEGLDDHVARVRLFDCGRLDIFLLPLHFFISLYFFFFFFFSFLPIVFFSSGLYGMEGVEVEMSFW